MYAKVHDQTLYLVSTLRVYKKQITLKKYIFQLQYADMNMDQRCFLRPDHSKQMNITTANLR